MKTKTSAVFAALTGAALLGAVSMPAELEAKKKKKKEKCYGIVAKGMNDCAANGHSCAGQAKADNDPHEWIYLPKGLCQKIAGGKLKPGKG